MGDRMDVDGGAGREEEPPEPVVDVADVNTTRARRRMYLVKLPDFLMEHLERERRAGGEHANLGTLRLPSFLDGVDEDDADDDLERPVKRSRAEIELAVEASDPIPAKYEIELAPDHPSMQIYSIDPLDENAQVFSEGTVTYQCTALAPVSDPKYEKFKRRNLSSSIPTTSKMVIVGDGDGTKARVDALLPSTVRVTAEEREAQKRGRERVVIEEPEEEWQENVKIMIFNLFGRKSHWRFEEIRRELRQPPGKLKPLVEKLCSYNKRGPFTGQYELRDEYKTAKQREEVSESVALREAEQLERTKERAANEDRFRGHRR